jgi:hypothetical protein
MRHESALGDGSDAKRSLDERTCRHLIETQENVLQESIGAFRGLAKLRASSCPLPNPRMGSNSKADALTSHVFRVNNNCDDH